MGDLLEALQNIFGFIIFFSWRSCYSMGHAIPCFYVAGTMPSRGALWRELNPSLSCLVLKFRLYTSMKGSRVVVV